MSILDSLRETTRRQQSGAVPPPQWSADAPEVTDHCAGDGERAPSGTPPETPSAYCQYWIAQLALGQPLRSEQLEGTPVGLRPPPAEALLLAAAGQALPVEQVTSWLQLKARLPSDADRAAGAVARYWLKRLAPPALNVDPKVWAAHCQAVAREAEAQDMSLDPRVLQAWQDHPQWAFGYLRCCEAKARVLENLTRSVASAEGTAHSAPNARPFDTAPGPTAQLSAPSGPNAPSLGLAPAYAPSGAAAVGSTVGALLGGAWNALRATGAAAATVAKQAVPQRPEWLNRLAAGTYQRTAEQALTAFTTSADEVRHHPALRAFWMQVDQYTAQHGLDRQVLFQAIADETEGGPAAPAGSLALKTQLRDALHADPSLAARIERAYQAFDRLCSAWGQCTTQGESSGARWTPSPDQIQRLKAASLDVPPLTDRSTLVAAAERLVQSLLQFARTVKAGWRTTDAPAAPPPSPCP